MLTLTADDLARDPRRLLAESDRAAVKVLSPGGKPLMLALPLADDQALAGALVDLAAQLYDAGKISLERAARIAGLSYSETMDEFGRRGVATIRLEPGELKAELAAFEP